MESNGYEYEAYEQTYIQEILEIYMKLSQWLQ
jgi:hypothetical protein